ncbi:hypothetical protein K438DRAFT_1819226 [Mycena galopus ATCC 62051]|nr:hypothetical protein K438DRAFT_1819221 [Mycena galopus ATCC 62051]KAF8204164.1 hypothetical protein K438DRAFT_1819226 [Mycena galopus ATCC 62051]
MWPPSLCDHRNGLSSFSAHKRPHISNLTSPFWELTGAFWALAFSQTFFQAFFEAFLRLQMTSHLLNSFWPSKFSVSHFATLLAPFLPIMYS